MYHFFIVDSSSYFPDCDSLESQELSEDSIQSPSYSPLNHHLSCNSPLNTQIKEKNKRKILRQANIAGIAHLSARGDKIIKDKPMKSGCAANCRLKCNTYLTTEDREKFRNLFRGIQDIDVQRQFILGHLLRSSFKFHRTNTFNERRSNWIFFISIKDQKKRVCKKMFLDTLGKLNRFFFRQIWIL